MKTIGLIGGITWHSTMDYYRLINELTNQRLGGVHSARIILHSLEFDEIKTLTQQLDWDALADLMKFHAKKIEAAGAECLLIGANTMHHIADIVQEAINIPLIHVAGAVGEVIKERHIKQVALLGTKYTMQMNFYKGRLAQKGIAVLIPGEEDIVFIDDAIYNEMAKGQFLPQTGKRFISIIESLYRKGAEGVVFGCTEIPILVKQEDCSLPIFDSALIHASAAVDFALE